jgi:hypothetical protein
MIYVVPTLQELAARKLKQFNRNIFFQPQIKVLLLNQEISAVAQEIIEENEEIYIEEVNLTQKKLEKSDCFSKTCGFSGMAITTGIYIGIGYPIIQATGASFGTQTAFYTFGIVVFAVSGCISACLNNKAAHVVAQCITPKSLLRVEPDIEAARPRIKR